MTGARILVVDDEPQILRALLTNLRGAGYEVDTADTAERAIAAAAMRPPDAVILDLVLPDGRGTDVCREFRRWSAASIMAQNEGKLMTHPAILREVWGPAYGRESHYPHVYISQLLRKIEPDPTRPRYLLTEPSAGYRLVDPLAKRS